MISGRQIPPPLNDFFKFPTLPADYYTQSHVFSFKKLLKRLKTLKMWRFKGKKEKGHAGNQLHPHWSYI